MAHTFTETVGIIEGVIAHLKNTDNAATLTAAGFPVAARLARLQAKLDKMNADNAEQEKRKVAVKQQTAILEASTEDGYTDVSGAVDAIADAYGKNSDAAKNVLKIRSAVRRGPNTPPPATPSK